MQINMHPSYPYLFLMIINYQGIYEVKDRKGIVGGTDFTNAELSFKVQCVELYPASYQMLCHTNQ